MPPRHGNRVVRAWIGPTFEVRYHDPCTSPWITTDPAQGEYLPNTGKVSDSKSKLEWLHPDLSTDRRPTLDMSGAEGVFEPRNGNLHSYTQQKPVMNEDPDGNAISKAVTTDGKLTYRACGRHGHLERIARHWVDGCAVTQAPFLRRRVTGRAQGNDLRERVLMEAERASARAAGVRFGVSPATATRRAARALNGESGWMTMPGSSR